MSIRHSLLAHFRSFLVVSLAFNLSGYTQSLATLGMSPAEVKAVETNVLIKDTVTGSQSLLVYKGKLQSLEATYWNIFNDNKLRHTEYLLKGSAEDCLKEHGMISQSFTEKYGALEDSKEDWKNEYYKANPERRGRAPELDNLKFVSRWETSDLKVEIRLWENNMSSLLVIHYADKRSRSGEKK